MKFRSILIISIILLITTLTTPAMSVPPNNQGCLGKSVNPIAQQYGALFGKGVSIVAIYPDEIPGSTFNSLGEGVQALLGGYIPDVIVPLPDGTYALIKNTCND